MKRPFVCAAFAALMMFSLGTRAVPIVQLGFALDASDNVSSEDYGTMLDGIAGALAGLPLDGSVELTLVGFSTTTQQILSNQVLTERSLPRVQRLIGSAAVRKGSGTGRNVGRAIDRLLTEMSDPESGARAVINVATSGLPTDAVDLLRLDSVVSAARRGGYDALSFEVLGAAAGEADTLATFQGFAFPDPATVLTLNSTRIPDPSGGSWVLPLSDYDAFGDAIEAKTRAIVYGSASVPEPTALALIGIGLVGLVGARRRARRG